MTVKKAEAALRELERERGSTLARIDALEGEREGAKVSRLGPIATELAELRSTLAVLDERLNDARGVLADEERQANEAAVRALWLDERVHIEKAVKLVGELRSTCEQLETVRRSIEARGGMTKSRPYDLLRALRNIEKTWAVGGYWHTVAGEPGGPPLPLPDPPPRFVVRRAKRGEPARLRDFDGHPLAVVPVGDD